jgi:hypothetical protein
MDKLENLIDKVYNRNEKYLFGLEPESQIFRIMKIENFKTILLNKTLLFKRPELWDDPYENFISKEQLGWYKGKPYYVDLNMLYAQCWTLNKQCDGMWRSFASLENGIKIKTNTQKLYSILHKTNIDNIFIGKVFYDTKENIKNFIDHPEFLEWLHSMHPQILAEIFLLKRQEFGYENEVRVLIIDFDNTKCNLEIAFDPIELIEEIEFSPKIDKAKFLQEKCKLVNDFGFDENIIKISDLYDPF